MVTSAAEKIEIDRIAKERNKSAKEIIDVVESMYDFIRNKIVVMEFKNTNLTKEEFDNLKTNFNIPCIGKFCASYRVYKHINKTDNDI